eukprot:1154708-Pelagomonas_calceolata.AAC.2
MAWMPVATTDGGLPSRLWPCLLHAAARAAHPSPLLGARTCTKEAVEWKLHRQSLTKSRVQQACHVAFPAKQSGCSTTVPIHALWDVFIKMPLSNPVPLFTWVGGVKLPDCSAYLSKARLTRGLMPKKGKTMQRIE